MGDMDLSALSLYPGRYLLFPLRSASLILIAIFSFLLMLASGAGLIGIPLGCIASLWFAKYAFVLMDSAMEGAKEPPVLSAEMVNPVDEQRPIVLVLMVAAVYSLASAASYWLGSAAALVFSLAAVATIPAILAVQGATGSVWQSFNPVTVLALIARLRTGYLALLACIVTLAALGRFVMTTDAADVPAMLRVAVVMYLWLAAHSLIGGLLFTRRWDIGLDAALAPEQIEARKNRELERERDRQVDRIYAEWRGGVKANAWKTVLKMIAESGEPLEELRWLHRRTSGWPEPGLANRLARELLPRLLAARHFSEALAVVQSRIQADANFRPATSSELLVLVRLARDAGDRPTARMLLSDFARYYPEDKEQRTADILAQQLER